MKQLIIICEGQTEQAFCSQVLYDHFLQRGIQVHYPTIRKSNGGIVSWMALKRDIERYLHSPTATVTTLIDYYGLTAGHGFPGWHEALQLAIAAERVTYLESAMRASISDRVSYRFTPYLQLYEFEALLFSNADAFVQIFEPEEVLDVTYLQQTLKLPPETINDSPNSAPSKRLQRIIRGYNKVTHGVDLAKAIGLTDIRLQCPRFNRWLTQLELLR